MALSKDYIMRRDVFIRGVSLMQPGAHTVYTDTVWPGVRPSDALRPVQAVNQHPVKVHQRKLKLTYSRLFSKTFDKTVNKV